MKRFMLLHYGFEKPTPEIMEAWGKWFQQVGDKTTDQGGFHGGAREISHDGSTDLPMGPDSITGYNIIGRLFSLATFARDRCDAAVPRFSRILLLASKDPRIRINCANSSHTHARRCRRD